MGLPARQSYGCVTVQPLTEGGVLGTGGGGQCGCGDSRGKVLAHLSVGTKGGCTLDSAFCSCPGANQCTPLPPTPGPLEL